MESDRATQPIDPAAFVECVAPLLERKDLTGLVSLCRSRWTPEQIVSLLTSRHCDARKVAALGLSLVGCRKCLPPLVERLKDPDPMVNQMAEHAIWSIWFRLGTDCANHQVCRGTLALGRREFDHAISHFSRAIELCPSFAEAYNQRAIAHYLKEEYEDSLEDCRSAVEHMPIHFGAWAGMGHCHAHLGQLRDALGCYERALEIYPRIEGIGQVIRELRAKLREK